MRVIYIVFAVFLMALMATPAKSQPKRSCRGHCSRTCGKGEREEHAEDCGRMHCCLTHRKKK
ncbi:small basic protein 1-like [Poecile atricapillus]|uniref:small basic protein 1-like n=1 Tax=Poecile atricapillus TaxID=48891 RepID=UPI00273A085A|nr:small basic protein 1-like [Poecile atricapillus]